MGHSSPKQENVHNVKNRATKKKKTNRLPFVDLRTANLECRGSNKTTHVGLY